MLCSYFLTLESFWVIAAVLGFFLAHGSLRAHPKGAGGPPDACSIPFRLFSTVFICSG